MKRLLFLLVLFAFVVPAGAQVTTGTILGTISDPTGAVIPGALVTATNLDTALSRAVKTDAAGSYTLPNMPLGKYQVKAEAEGFKAAQSGPFTLVVDQKLRSDFMLQVGAKSEVIEIQGVGATLLQTDQPDINQLVQEREIRALPLNGRDFFSLLLLTNGIQDTSNDVGGATTNVTFSVNGMRPEANSVTLDGIEMSSIRESDVDLRPSLDAISEFKVLTSVFSAEYGHTAGGVISIQSKSGTNLFHGSAWEFLRNDALNSANFFRNPVAPDKAALKQNMFGASLGGPIQKDKTFFFLDYQGYVLRKINEAFARVPEVALRNGDFSSLLPGTAIWDPATGGTVQFRDPSRATPGNPQGLNIIPTNRFHPFGWAVINAAAIPNLPANYPLGNYFVRQPDRVYGNEAGMRIDRVFSEKNNVFLRFRANDGLTNTGDPLARPDGPWPGIGLEVGDDTRGIVQGGTHRDRNRNLVFSHVHVFSPAMVNEVRAGFHRYLLDVVAHAYGMNLAEKFGLKGLNTEKEFSGLPIIYMNAYNSLGGDDWKPLFFRETSAQFNDNLTRTVGRHTLKLGVEYRRRYENNYFAIFPAGAFYVYGENTSKEFSYVGGHELADVLLGLPMMGFHGRRFGNTDLRDNQYSFYVQNDWKATDRLTLNFGVRYEYVSPYFQPDNQMAMFDFAQNKMLIAGQSGVSRYIVNPDKNNWAPRVGLAFKLQPKTTVRAGFGAFYDPENARRDDIRYNPPFYRQYSTFESQWTFWTTPPPFTDPGSLPAGYDLYINAREMRTGYSEQYSLAIQRELPHALLVEAAYVGSQAHKLPYRYNFNQPQPRGGPVPYPNLGKINYVDDIGNMAYHSGQFKVERRFAAGLYFLASYTWSKSIDTVSSVNFTSSNYAGIQNIFDPKQNRGVSDWDVPHRVAYSYVYDLPFGKGRRFLAGARPLVNVLFGDWQATGILVASSGVPATVVVGSTIPGGDARPDVVKSPKLANPAPDRWFDTSAFVINRNSSGGTIAGNAGRNILRGARYGNVDLGLAKYFPINEKVRVQFRGEIFNLTNSPHFALPQVRMSDPAFGRITHTRNPVNFGSTATSYANRMLQFALRLEF